jgi:hypothetical protein
VLEHWTASVALPPGFSCRDRKGQNPLRRSLMLNGRRSDFKGKKHWRNGDQKRQQGLQAIQGNLGVSVIDRMT